MDIFAFLSPILSFVWNLPAPLLNDFIVCCKGCGENVPAPVETLPSSWIVTECPLCGDRRRYLPPDIFRGRLSHKLALGRKPVKSERGYDHR